MSLAFMILLVPVLAAAGELQEANKALMRRFYEEVWFKGNLGVADELFAPSYTVHDPRDTRGRVQQNPEAQKQIAASWRGMADIGGRITSQVAEADLVVTHWLWRVRMKSAWRRGLAGVDVFEIPVIQTVRIRDSRVVEMWSLRDDLGLEERLGVIRLYYVQGFLLGLITWAICSRILRRRRPPDAAPIMGSGAQAK
jgi:predicted SnoaL-like aldol condensation-catalyzing enzyme